MSAVMLTSGRPKDWQHVWRLVSPYRPTMSLLAVVSFAGALLEAAFLVLLTGTVVALAAGQESLTPVFGFSFPVRGALAVAGVAIFLRLIIGLSGAHLAARLVANVTVDERRRLSEGFLRASWAVQQAEPSGRLQELMGSFVARASFTATALTQGITAALSLLAFLGTGVAIDALLTLGVLVALVLLGSVLAPLRTRIRRLSGRSSRTGLTFANSVAEFAGLGQEMHTFGAQSHFLNQIDLVSREAADDARRVQTAQGQLTPVYTFLAYGAVILGIGALLMLGFGDLASVGAVMLLMLRSLSYAQSLLTVSGQFASSIPYLQRFESVLDGYRAQAAHRGERCPDQVAPVEFNQVDFSYDGERAALTNASFTIEPGEIIGVIGPSGSGKSTLAQLLLGLRDPSRGLILAGGMDLRDIDRDWWTSRVSFVPQDPVLFTGTVAENIRFFREDISEEAMRSAAARANVLTDVEALSDGFDTHLGERGSQLSGGQRQRLSIARALVGRPELLIMDEPTSALDGKSEGLILDTMGLLRGEVTMVVIAHRMSTLELCDRIMVIEHGRVTGFSTPSALYRRSSFYREALATAGMGSNVKGDQR